MKKPKTEKEVRAYIKASRQAGLVEEEVADILEDGLTAGYESDFDRDALKRGRSVLAVEMAEMRVSDMAAETAYALAWLTTDPAVKKAAARLAGLLK